MGLTHIPRSETISSKLRHTINLVQMIFAEDEKQGLGPEERRKIIVGTEWASLCPDIETVCTFGPSCSEHIDRQHSTQAFRDTGITASVLNGNMESAQKAQVLRDYNLPGPHKDSHGADSWVLIMSTGLMVGANCQRGSVIIMMVGANLLSEEIFPLLKSCLTGRVLELRGL